jgi:hypothetical protein
MRGQTKSWASNSASLALSSFPDAPGIVIMSPIACHRIRDSLLTTPLALSVPSMDTLIELPEAGIVKSRCQRRDIAMASCCETGSNVIVDNNRVLKYVSSGGEAFSSSFWRAGSEVLDREILWLGIFGMVMLQNDVLVGRSGGWGGKQPRVTKRPRKREIASLCTSARMELVSNCLGYQCEAYHHLDCTKDGMQESTITGMPWKERLYIHKHFPK